MQYEDGDPYIYWSKDGCEWNKVVTTYGEYKKLDKTDVKEIEITDRSTWQ